MINVDQASFAYDNGHVAVDNVTLHIADNERLAIIGQNGAGKTTLSRLLNGLRLPSKGTVAVNGAHTHETRTDQISSIVGYVFQNPDDQIFCRTIEAEIRYALDAREIAQGEREERITWAAQTCGLEKELQTNPLDLPLARRKFVTIAALLATRPKYLILDEPTAGLDAVGTATLLNIIDVAQAKNMALIAITHDMRFVIEHFKRVVVMADAAIIADGTTTEVFANNAILERAHLSAPSSVQLAREYGAPSHILTYREIEEFFVNLLQSPQVHD